MLVDHALAYGWDQTYGGFFQEGTTFGQPESRLKERWVGMEGLDSLLLMRRKVSPRICISRPSSGNGSSFSTTRPMLNFTECTK